VQAKVRGGSPRLGTGTTRRAVSQFHKPFLWWSGKALRYKCPRTVETNLRLHPLTEARNAAAALHPWSIDCLRRLSELYLPRFQIRVFLLLDRLPSMADEL